MRSKRVWIMRPKTTTDKTHDGAGARATSASGQSTQAMTADSENERQHRLGPIHDAGPEHHANGVQIVRSSRHDVAGAELPVEVPGERDRAGKEIVSEIELDIAGDADDDDAHPVLEHALDRGQARRAARRTAAL